MRALAQVLSGVLAGAIVAGCTGPGPSHLVVNNRTTVPIVFRDDGIDYYVAPCSIARYIAWNETWQRDPPADEVAIPGAVRVGIYPMSLPDMYVNYTATVTSDKVTTQDALIEPVLPGCAGVPPPPGPDNNPYVPPGSSSAQP